MTATIDTMGGQRRYAPHKPSWQRFHGHAAPKASNSGCSGASEVNAYSRQYSHVYRARLEALRKRCVDNAKAALREEGVAEDVVVSDQIIEVSEGTLSIIVGTVVKEMDPKTRRLKVNHDTYGHLGDASTFLFPDNDKAGFQQSMRSLVFDSSKGDTLYLEDESGRVELAPDDDEEDGVSSKSISPLDPNGVTTGVVVAITGKICAEKGVMKVKSVHFAGPPKPASSAMAKPSADEPVLLLVSGLGCGADAPRDAKSGASLALRREMLLEYVTDAAFSGSSVSHILVAGGGINVPKMYESEKENEAKSYGKGKSSSSATSSLAFSLRELDMFLSELLASGIPLDYIPGMHDPTNANWPQRPIHSCLLPNACGYSESFGRTTNPYEGQLSVEGESSGVRVLGTDGLNIADLRRYLATRSDESGEGESDTSEPASCIDALNQTLRYGHIAPTGPSSLPTFPAYDFDPFVLKSRPDIYFAGNCHAFETRMVDDNCNEVKEGGKTRLICVPNFALTGEVVLVKLQSLECEVIEFSDWE